MVSLFVLQWIHQLNPFMNGQNLSNHAHLNRDYYQCFLCCFKQWLCPRLLWDEISSSNMRLDCSFWDGLGYVKLLFLFLIKIFLGRCLSIFMSSATYALQTETKQFLYFCLSFLFLLSVVPFGWPVELLVTPLETLFPESPNNVDC